MPISIATCRSTGSGSIRKTPPISGSSKDGAKIEIVCQHDVAMISKSVAVTAPTQHQYADSICDAARKEAHRGDRDIPTRQLHDVVRVSGASSRGFPS
jgi:hypothetical protein